VLLIDDFQGRKAAVRRGIRVLGALGLLERAANAGLLQLEDAIDRIRQTDFRVSDDLIDAILNRYRKSQSAGD
jgi:predicted nucleic acid-binding protein